MELHTALPHFLLVAAVSLIKDSWLWNCLPLYPFPPFLLRNHSSNYHLLYFFCPLCVRAFYDLFHECISVSFAFFSVLTDALSKQTKLCLYYDQVEEWKNSLNKPLELFGLVVLVRNLFFIAVCFCGCLFSTFV